MDEQYFKVMTEDGSEQLCKVVITFDTDDFSYVLYTLVDKDGNESDEVSALRYELDENGEMTDFSSLETDVEWEMVDEVLNTLISEFGDEQEQEDFFMVTNEDGEDVLCEVLHRFELKEFGKSYLLYSFANEEQISEIYAAAYTAGENGEVQELLPIDSDREWAKVEEQLEFLNN